jgi:2-C-methyl-D-erythritol 4-phosphate cytidylyltransferase
MSKKSNVAIILAGGTGSRMGFETPKQLIMLAGKPVLQHTLEVFEAHPGIQKIYVVMESKYLDQCLKLIEEIGFRKVAQVLVGGSTRAASTSLALEAIGTKFDNVLIHDAVRPFLTAGLLSECIEALEEYPAVDTAINSADTLIKLASDGTIDHIPERASLMRGQTPQAFRLDKLRLAYEKFNQVELENFTDDCGVFLAAFPKEKIGIVRGSSSNIKLTEPIDFHIAEKIFQTRTSNLNSVHEDELDRNVTGKKVLVIGGTSGIGAMIDLSLKARGAHTLVASRRTGCDVGNYSAVKKTVDDAFKSLGGLDAIFLTAGKLTVGDISESTEREVDSILATNLVGVVNVMRASHKILHDSRGSLVLFTSSSYTRGRPGYALYSATKAGVVNLMQAFAEENPRIRVNCVNPERTATPMRETAFGFEDRETLLTPTAVALEAIKVAFSENSGQVINVRKPR